MKFLYHFTLAWTAVMTVFQTVVWFLVARGSSLDGTVAVWEITDFWQPALISSVFALLITVAFYIEEY